MKNSDNPVTAPCALRDPDKRGDSLRRAMVRSRGGNVSVWLGLTLAVILLRFALYYAFRQRKPAPEHRTRWFNLFLALISVAAWRSSKLVIESLRRHFDRERAEATIEFQASASFNGRMELI